MSLALAFALGCTYTCMWDPTPTHMLCVAMLESFMAGQILEEETLGGLGNDGSESIDEYEQRRLFFFLHESALKADSCRKDSRGIERSKSCKEKSTFKRRERGDLAWDRTIIVMGKSGRRNVKRKKEKNSRKTWNESMDLFHPAYASAILAFSTVQQLTPAEGFEKDYDI